MSAPSDYLCTILSLAQRFRVTFASDKFELTHFIHSYIKFNLTITV